MAHFLKYLVFGAVSAAVPAFGNVYNVANDFPNSAPGSNPSGVWTYGYSLSYGSAFIPYTAAQFHDGNTIAQNGVSLNSAPGLTAYEFTGGSFGVPLIGKVSGENQLRVHPGQFGEYAIVEFTAPKTSLYSINSSWVGIDPGGSNGTDVHVVTPGKTYDGISNYNSAASFPLPSVALNAGQTVDFEIGNHGNFYYDTTGFTATVVNPEPGFYGMMGLGLSGLVVAVRRRRNS